MWIPRLLPEMITWYHRHSSRAARGHRGKFSVMPSFSSLLEHLVLLNAAGNVKDFPILFRVFTCRHRLLKAWTHQKPISPVYISIKDARQEMRYISMQAVKVHIWNDIWGDEDRLSHHIFLPNTCTSPPGLQYQPERLKQQPQIHSKNSIVNILDITGWSVWRLNDKQWR